MSRPDPLMPVIVSLIAVPVVGCVLALSGLDADRLRAGQELDLATYQDDAGKPGDRQRARASYCLRRATLVDNGLSPIDAGPGAACEPR